MTVRQTVSVPSRACARMGSCTRVGWGPIRGRPLTVMDRFHAMAETKRTFV